MLSLATLSVAAQEVKPFVRGSLGEIVNARQGRPFILGFWSLTCSHCRQELSLLSELARRYPALDLVLISTDTADDAPAIADTLRGLSLEKAESWVFADSFPERLRFDIDRKWHGELPRTYLYDSAHTITAYSGKPDPQPFERWIRANFTAR